MTGVVLDVGDGATHVLPIADDYVIGGSIRSIPISGKDVTLFVQQLIRVGNPCGVKFEVYCAGICSQLLVYVNCCEPLIPNVEGSLKLLFTLASEERGENVPPEESFEAA
ncbi:hypothetical protein RIF29_14972 [Crotalaria pallida]|uniref:Actin-related protein 3 n=1 Tax=Crotalaria pallida TaxID=3830 RepID=A0AAN9FE79_CROPI